MPDPFVPSHIIPPGINDERSRALVSAFSDELEAVELNRLLVQNALTVDERLLPAMAVARAMTDFIVPNMRIDLVRQLLHNYRELHENSGYIRGTRLALSLIGVSVDWVQWWQEQPKAAHDTHKIQVWFSSGIFDAGVPADAQHQAFARKLVDVTKRWSQDITVSFGIRSTAQLYAGARAASGGRYVAALPGDAPLIHPVIDFVATAATFGGTFEAGLEI